jgi:hypothetical protein
MEIAICNIPEYGLTSSMTTFTLQCHACSQVKVVAEAVGASIQDPGKLVQTINVESSLNFTIEML